MIEVLLACALTFGQDFAPPTDWTVVSVKGGGVSRCCSGGSCLAVMNCRDMDVPAVVTVKRQVKSGAPVMPPSGCSLTEVKPKAESGTITIRSW